MILNYSLGEDAPYPNPLVDASVSMKLIRENAEDWSVIQDQIAIGGFAQWVNLCMNWLARNDML